MSGQPQKRTSYSSDSSTPDPSSAGNSVGSSVDRAADRAADRSVRSPRGSQTRSQCLISFGSNLGDRHDLIAEAARRISDSMALPAGCSLRTSRLFQTPPIGGPDGQEPFLNAVGAFDTDASARDILALLQSIEIDLGRQRHQRWDSRSIDLDVVLHGELVGGGTGLIVPHPRYTARQFVLKPACDVAADYRDPRFGWTLKSLSQHVSAGNPSMALVGGEMKTREILCDRLTKEHGIRTFAAHPPAQPMKVVGNAPAPIQRDRAPIQRDRAQADQVASDSTNKDLMANKDSVDRHENDGPGQPIVVYGDDPWVAAYLPKLPIGEPPESPAVQSSSVPRLVVRLQHAMEPTGQPNNQPASEHVSTGSRWPAPHQMWPSGWQWPEYRLEVNDLSWAVRELASALESMRCEVTAVTEDGNWWR